jgi:hypothetical protein
MIATNQSLLSAATDQGSGDFLFDPDEKNMVKSVSLMGHICSAFVGVPESLLASSPIGG